MIGMNSAVDDGDRHAETCPVPEGNVIE
jgi:hypothetical protein